MRGRKNTFCEICRSRLKALDSLLQKSETLELLESYPQFLRKAKQVQNRGTVSEKLKILERIETLQARTVMPNNTKPVSLEKYWLPARRMWQEGLPLEDIARWYNFTTEAVFRTPQEKKCLKYATWKRTSLKVA